MRPPRRVALVFGGRSVEHEVSIDSARTVRGALDDAGFVCVPIAVAGDGRWLSPERSARVLDGGARRVEVDPQGDGDERLALVPGSGDPVCLSPGREPCRVEVDVVFPLVHGQGGEDGRMQGAFEIAGIPYVGSGVLGSAVAMDKAMAKRILDSHGIPVVPWVELGPDERDPSEAARLGYPLFVKPANGGSSVGISRVETARDLDRALERAFVCDRRVVVERGLDAHEVECAVVGGRPAEASGLGEIVPAGAFYDYESKYEDGSSRLIIPADLPDATAAAIRDQATAAFAALDLWGLARVDFLVEREGGRVYLNEVNTLPGFTAISMFPKLWEAAGWPAPRLVARLIELADMRFIEQGRLRTRLRDG